MLGAHAGAGIQVGVGTPLVDASTIKPLLPQLPPASPSPRALAQRAEPSEEAVAAAEALVAALDLPDFDVWQVANPALQRHYEVRRGGVVLGSGSGQCRVWCLVRRAWDGLSISHTTACAISPHPPTQLLTPTPTHPPTPHPPPQVLEAKAQEMEPPDPDDFVDYTLPATDPQDEGVAAVAAAFKVRPGRPCSRLRCRSASLKVSSCSALLLHPT